MTQTKVNSVLFDPGYAQHTTILSMSSEYIYAQISQFKNMNQRKIKFKMLFPQLVRMSDNNVGFCLGSLLWAVYIKSLGDNIEIEGNPCIGGTYDEAETVEEADFSIAFFEKLNKDSKYYLGKEYKYDEILVKILEVYKEFLTLNCGFVSTKTTGDVQLPRGIKIPNDEVLEKIHDKIQEVIKSGNLLDLLPMFSLIYEG